MNNEFKLTVPRDKDPMDYLRENAEIEDVWVYIHKSCILNMTSHGSKFKSITNGMRCKEKGLTLTNGPVPGWYLISSWAKENYELFDVEDPKQAIALKMEDKIEKF